MNTISLCMIVKNEETDLAACLDSVSQLVDEIIIVDTGSTDKTEAVARRYTDKVYHFKWVNDFAAARNFSFSKAAMDYIFWLDADDILTPENQGKFRTLKDNLNGVDLVLMPYHYSHDAAGNVKSIQTRERIMKRSCGFSWSGAVHETINLAGFSGSSVTSDVVVTHTKNFNNPDIAAMTVNRNHEILENTIKNGNYTVRDMYYYAIALAAGSRQDEALPYLLKFIEQPGNMLYSGFAVYLQAFNIYLKKGMFDDALKIMEDYKDRNRHLSEYWCTLGMYYQKKERNLQKAKITYQKALKCDGYGPNGLKSAVQTEYYYYIPYIKLGEVSMELNQYADALNYLEAAFRYNPKDKTLLELIKDLQQLTSKKT